MSLRLTPIVAKFQEIKEMISSVGQWFSVPDLSNAFFSILLHKSVWYKFAFTFNNCQYTFIRVPWGFHNAPSICHKHVSKMWDGIAEKNSVISYVDDVLIAMTTSEENLKLMDTVLGRTKTTGFIVNPTKTQMVLQKVTYLAMEIGIASRCTAYRAHLQSS